MPGAQCTRSLACELKKAHEQVTAGSPETPGIPARAGLRLIRDLPGVHDFLVTVARAMRKASVRELGTSQGVPGPHDFAVRDKHCPSCNAAASIASRPTFVTTRTPLIRDGTGESIHLIAILENRILFLRRD